MATLLLLILALLPARARAGDAALSRAENFKLLDQDGRARELYRQKGPAVVIVSYGIGCPIARQTVTTLEALKSRYEAKGVTFWLLDSMSSGDRAQISKEAADYRIDLPILSDESQIATRALGIERTAEALVLDPANWRIVYRGAVDDRFDYGAARPAPTRNYVADAIEARLAGKDPSTRSTDAKGCLVRPSAAERPVSYVKEAGPILAAKCLGCHREADEPAPMASYEAVRRWSPMIRETLLTRRMPPWQADPAYGHFQNDVSLSAAEMKALSEWIDQGSPRDAGEDPVAAAAALAPAEKMPPWTPSVALKAARQEIPAAGDLPLRDVPLEFRTTETVLLSGLRFYPGNRRVLHHVDLFELHKPFEAYGTGRGNKLAEGPDAIVLVGAAPGSPRQWTLPPGTAMAVAPGSQLMLELHYRPDGRPEEDFPELDLLFNRDAPAPKIIHRRLISAPDIRIPAGKKDWPIRYETTLTRAIDLYWLHLHMHNRGTSIRCSVRYPDGRAEILASVPDFQYDWQWPYIFTEVKRLPAGAAIVLEGTFDNSPENPSNPDPGSDVGFGMMKNGEMLQVRLYYADADGPDPR